MAMKSNDNYEKKEKSGFLKNILVSIKDFDKYEELSNEGPKKTIIYLIGIVAIFVLIASLMSLYRFSKDINNAIEIYN